jgi:hypothetical protein
VQLLPDPWRLAALIRIATSFWLGSVNRKSLIQARSWPRQNATVPERGDQSFLRHHGLKSSQPSASSKDISCAFVGREEVMEVQKPGL